MGTLTTHFRGQITPMKETSPLDYLRVNILNFLNFYNYTPAFWKRRREEIFFMTFVSDGIIDYVTDAMSLLFVGLCPLLFYLKMTVAKDAFRNP